MATKTKLELGYIKKLPRNPTKDEEIAFITDVVESIPKSSYLTDFFNKECIYYIDRIIRDDFALDPEYFFEQQVEKAAKEIIACKDKEIAELKKKLEQTERQMYISARERNEAVKKVDDLKKLLS